MLPPGKRARSKSSNASTNSDIVIDAKIQNKTSANQLKKKLKTSTNSSPIINMIIEKLEPAKVYLNSKTGNLQMNFKSHHRYQR